MRQHETPFDLPSGTSVLLHGQNLTFPIEGCFAGQYDRLNSLRAIQFLFRETGQEAFLSSIFDTALPQAKIFSWSFDAPCGPITFTRHWFSYLGIPDGDDTIAVEALYSLAHPDDLQALQQAFALPSEGAPVPLPSAFRLRRGDGTWEWFEGQPACPAQDDGSPCRVAGICQSIHRHKTAEERLRAACDKARESDRLKSAFLANMSHEIRTPLNAIIGFADLLTNDDIPFSEEERKEYSRLITTNGDQLLRLISDILDLSKIESNTMEFCFGQQSLHALLSDIAQAQRLNMPPGVELRLELPPCDTTVYTDASRLKQVVNNLINNAVKFTRQGSIRFGYRVPEGARQVELFVRDTGNGIRQEDMERIFERFYKADTRVKGVGLGLSICRTITELLGGSISVASVPGEGTCFKIVHPLGKEGEVRHAVPKETV